MASWCVIQERVAYLAFVPVYYKHKQEATPLICNLTILKGGGGGEVCFKDMASVLIFPKF